MSNKDDYNADEWGNIELPGLNDDELFKKDWDKSQREKTKWQTSPNSKKRRENIRKGVVNRNKDPEYWEKYYAAMKNKDLTQQSERLKEKHKDKKWQAKIIEAALDSRKNKEYWEKYNAGIEKRNQNEEWKKNVGQSAKLRFCKPVITPWGEFESATEFERQCPIKIFFTSKMKQMPHLYYYKSEGPGEPTYEWVHYTPIGVFKTSKNARDEHLVNNPNLPVTWWSIITKKDPENYYRHKEVRREWLLENN